VSTHSKRDFISFDGLDGGQITAILDLAAQQKADPRGYQAAAVMKGRVAGLFFEKASLRTRLSFETAVYQLGGQCIYMGPECGRIGEREAIKDFAKVAARYLDVFILRTFKHETLTEIARHTNKPVINGLSDAHHPCQALGDLLTIREKLGGLNGVKVAFVGDCNNVCRSLAQALPKVGAALTIAAPRGYHFHEAFLKSSGVKLVSDPAEAVAGAAVIYTDVWASMGQENEAAKRRAIFQAYQVNAELLSKSPKALVMHCLPAHRGDEITDAVLDGPQSVVYDQAENRLHAQRALLCTLLA
jgi:ornithine carbamoyltransferase